jgi:toxin FitB
MKWLWDTNVVSETGKERPDRRVMAWIASLPQNDSAISLVTLAELQSVLGNARSERREQLVSWIESEVIDQFRYRILPVTVEILTDWLILGRRLSAKRAGRPAADTLIAATARVHALIVVTRNIRDFAGTGITVYNPWTDETTRMDAA